MPFFIPVIYLIGYQLNDNMKLECWYKMYKYCVEYKRVHVSHRRLFRLNVVSGAKF
jgi:hypothetical protein